MKQTMVRAAAANNGLRVLVRMPRLAVRAQQAGLFDVGELHLVFWTGTVNVPLFYVKQLPTVTKVSIPPGNEHVARRATSCLSYKLGRRILVESRSRTLSVPWQIGSAEILSAWLKRPPINQHSQEANLPPFFGPGFGFSLGADGDSTESEDAEPF